MRTDHTTDTCPYRQCSNCDEFGHIARDYDKEKRDNRVCNRCNERGYVSTDYPKPKKAGVCRNCNKEGHIAKECLTKRCPRYGKLGHMKAECKEPDKCDICSGPHKTAECQFEMGTANTATYIPGADERSELPVMGGLDLATWRQQYTVCDHLI